MVKRLGSIKMFVVVPIIVGALGTRSKNLHIYLEQIGAAIIV